MTRPRFRHRLNLAAAGLLAAAVVGATLTPAYAEGPRDTVAASSSAQTALASQYTSLSGALINLYARNAGLTLEEYLASQQILLSPPPLTDPVAEALGGSPDAPTDLPSDLPTDAAADPGLPSDLPTEGAEGLPSAEGLTAFALPTVPALGTADVLGQAAANATPVSAKTLTGLNKQLDAAGITLSTKGYRDLNALARSVVAKANTADGAVTLAGANWMRSLATLRTPQLKAPKTLDATLPGLPKDALVFGLFADKSLTNLVNTNPGLFAAAGKSGLGSKNLSSAWGKSMLEVYNSSQKDFSQVLPDPCTGGMLAVMASGKASSASKVSGSGCAPSCVTGGLYLHSQTTSLFSPEAQSTAGNPYSAVWNSSTLDGLQRWQQKQLLAQNPQLTNQLLADTRPTASASCSASSKATKNALGATLPGIFGQLRTQR